jgi:hypothetical protein
MLDAIATHLSAPNPRDALTSLFCEVLHWGQPQGVSFTCTVTVRQDKEAFLIFVPVAQLSGLPVLRVERFSPSRMRYTTSTAAPSMPSSSTC